MRELKFRAWDKSQKYMAYQGNPDLETLSSFMFHFGEDIVLQSTGLKDKKGNEIFEGDYLIQRTHPCSQIKNSEIDYDPLFDHYEIRWDSRKNGWNAFPVTALSGKDFDIAIQQLGGLITWPCEDVLANPFHYEIIGNIYENPELSQDVSYGCH